MNTEVAVLPDGTVVGHDDTGALVSGHVVERSWADVQRDVSRDGDEWTVTYHFDGYTVGVATLDHNPDIVADDPSFRWQAFPRKRAEIINGELVEWEQMTRTVEWEV